MLHKHGKNKKQNQEEATKINNYSCSHVEEDDTHTMKVRVEHSFEQDMTGN
ncbi:hypothetical protein OROMI_010020 [Orobanche minor]